jgi:hypothetical protein
MHKNSVQYKTFKKPTPSTEFNSESFVFPYHIYLKTWKFKYTDYNFVCYFVWVLNLVSVPQGIGPGDGLFWEQVSIKREYCVEVWLWLLLFHFYASRRDNTNADVGISIPAPFLTSLLLPSESTRWFKSPCSPVRTTSVVSGKWFESRAQTRSRWRTWLACDMHTGTFE